MIYNKEKLRFEIAKLEATKENLKKRWQEVNREVESLHTSLVEITGAIKGINGLILNIDKVEQAEKLKAKKAVKVAGKK